MLPKTHKLAVFFSLSILLMISGNTIAVEDTAATPETNIEINQLWALLEHTYQKLQSRMNESGDPDIAGQLLSSHCKGKTLDNWESKLLRAKAKAMANKKGLEFRAGYSTSGFDNVNQDPRSYLELSWDVLRNGYFDYRQRADILTRKAQIADIQAIQKQHRESYRCRRYQIATQFADLYTNLLTLKLLIMEPVHNIERRAYFKGWSYLDDYLVAAQDINLLRRELNYLNSDPDLDLTISSNIINPPVMDIDIQSLLSAIRTDQQHKKITLLEQAILKKDEQSQEKKRLRLFLRQDVDVANNNRNENNLVAGFRIYVPLEWNKNQTFDYKKKMLDESADNVIWERINRTKQAYTEQREQMQRVIKKYFQYQQSFERARRTFVAHGIGDDVDIAVAIMRMRALLSSAIELIRAKQSLYRHINNVLLTSGLSYDSSYLKPVSLHALDNRVRSGSRSIYLWSNAFNQMPNQQIMDFLHAKGIDRVLISAGKNTNRPKLDKFIRLTNHSTVKKVRIELIIGANQWVFPKNHERAASTAGIVAEKTGAIHLDIEPHTFDDYQHNPDSFLNNYISMLRKIRDAIDNRHLSISVPMSWPKPIYKEISQLADTVYIMAYGDKRISKLEKRLAKSISQLPPYKAVIVLRTADFVDEWALEQAFDKLRYKLGITQFAIHSFRSFVAYSGSEK